jgi:hypothetical protein
MITTLRNGELAKVRERRGRAAHGDFGRSEKHGQGTRTFGFEVIPFHIAR